MAKHRKDIKHAKPEEKKTLHSMAFTEVNYKWMLIGLAVIILGFILMYGKTDDIYSSSEALRNAKFSFNTHMKITVAPIVVLTGFVIEIIAIMKRPKKQDESA